MLQTGGGEVVVGSGLLQRGVFCSVLSHTQALPVPLPCSGWAAAPVLQGRTAEPEEKRVLVRRLKERPKSQFRAL